LGVFKEGAMRSFAEQVTANAPLLRTGVATIESTALFFAQWWLPQEEQGEESDEDARKMEDVTRALNLMQAEATQIHIDSKHTVLRSGSPTAFLDTHKWRARAKRRQRRF
jgi:hypothetical protein